MVRLRLLIVVLVAMAALGLACKPNLDDAVSTVDAPAVLAVRAEPAEAPPMASVQYEALFADGAGRITTGAITWAFCNERKPLAELAPVSPLCLEASGAWFTPVGSGTVVVGVVPSIACRQFGPDVPVPEANEPPGRPVDPDPTGGYYQPVRLLAPGSGGPVIAITETRLSCGVAGATPDETADFQHRYHVNGNPSVASLAIVGGASLVTDEGGAVNTMTAGQHVALRVAWASCPAVDACGDGICGPDETASSCPADCTSAGSCSGAERYVAFDPSVSALVDQREGIGVSWFTTGGHFDVDRTGRDAMDLTVTSDNGWSAPAETGLVTMWIVLRDDRGGVGWAEYAIEVR